MVQLSNVQNKMNLAESPRNSSKTLLAKPSMHRIMSYEVRNGKLADYKSSRMLLPFRGAPVAEPVKIESTKPITDKLAKELAGKKLIHVCYKGFDAKISQEGNGSPILKGLMPLGAGGVQTVIDTFVKLGGDRSNDVVIAAGPKLNGHNISIDTRHDGLIDSPVCVIGRPLPKAIYGAVALKFFWPGFHGFTNPDFIAEPEEKDWSSYREVSKDFAKQAAAHLTDDSLVIIHEMPIVPHELRRQRPDAKIALFHHITFAEPEKIIKGFGHEKAAETLWSMMQADMIGLHTTQFAKNLINTVEKLKNTEPLKGQIQSIHKTKDGGEITYIDESGRIRQTTVKAIPIGISYEKHNKAARKQCGSAGPKKLLQNIKARNPHHQTLFFFMSRVDYIKGIPQMMEAIEKAMDKMTEDERKKATFVIATSPTRVGRGVALCDKVNKELDTTIKRLNKKYGSDDYKIPIIHYPQGMENKQDPNTGEMRNEKYAFMRLADVLLAPSLEDGFNLSVPEIVAAKQEGDPTPVFIVGKNTGVAQSFGFDDNGSWPINPNNIDTFTDSIVAAHRNSMNTEEEVTERHQKQFKKLAAHFNRKNLESWALEMVTGLKKAAAKNEEGY